MINAWALIPHSSCYTLHINYVSRRDTQREKERLHKYRVYTRTKKNWNRKIEAVHQSGVTEVGNNNNMNVIRHRFSSLSVSFLAGGILLYKKLAGRQTHKYNRSNFEINDNSRRGWFKGVGGGGVRKLKKNIAQQPFPYRLYRVSLHSNINSQLIIVCNNYKWYALILMLSHSSSACGWTVIRSHTHIYKQHESEYR